MLQGLKRWLSSSEHALLLKKTSSTTSVLVNNGLLGQPRGSDMPDTLLHTLQATAVTCAYPTQTHMHSTESYKQVK